MTYRSQKFIVCGLVVVHAGLIAWAAWVHSPPIDEMAHLPAGLSHWGTGRIELYAVNPPLIRLIAAFPVWLSGHQYDWSAYESSIAARSEFAVGQDFIHANGEAALWYYRLARFFMLPFYCLGPVACFFLSRQHSGSNAAVLAAACYAVNPLMLGHSGLITPDVGSAVAGVIFVWIAASQRSLFSWRSIAVCGIAAGYVLCTKFTWLIVLPVTLLVRGVLSVGRPSARSLVVRLFCGLSLCLIVIGSVYGFRDLMVPLRDISLSSQTLTTGEERVSSRRTNRFKDHLIGQIPVPLPMSFVQGIDAQKRDFERGFRSYLMGQWRTEGWWYYYSTAFLVKEPIGFQILLYTSILHGLYHWKRWTKRSMGSWSLIVVPPLLVLLLVSSQTGFNHHIRYLLPAYPFLFIIAARTMTLGRLGRWLSYSCVAWQAAAVLTYAPHWMSYFNEAAGGPQNGHEWLVDSNIDWGQDIQLLKQWQDAHPETTPLRAALNTGFEPADIGLKYGLATPYVAGQSERSGASRGWELPAAWYAISVCQLKGYHYSVPNGDGSRTPSAGHFTYFMEHFEPVDMIGYSIYIYHITEEQAADVRQKLRQQEASIAEDVHAE